MAAMKPERYPEDFDAENGRYEILEDEGDDGKYDNVSYYYAHIRFLLNLANVKINSPIFWNKQLCRDIIKGHEKCIYHFNKFQNNIELLTIEAIQYLRNNYDFY